MEMKVHIEYRTIEYQELIVPNTQGGLFGWLFYTCVCFIFFDTLDSHDLFSVGEPHILPFDTCGLRLVCTNTARQWVHRESLFTVPSVISSVGGSLTLRVWWCDIMDGRNKRVCDTSLLRLRLAKLEWSVTSQWTFIIKMDFATAWFLAITETMNVAKLFHIAI